MGNGPDERGYIIERQRGFPPVYWLANRNGCTRDIAKAHPYTRQEFEQLHYRDSLDFIPLGNVTDKAHDD